MYFDRTKNNITARSWIHNIIALILHISLIVTNSTHKLAEQHTLVVVWCSQAEREHKYFDFISKTNIIAYRTYNLKMHTWSNNIRSAKSHATMRRIQRTSTSIHFILELRVESFPFIFIYVVLTANISWLRTSSVCIRSVCSVYFAIAHSSTIHLTLSWMFWQSVRFMRQFITPFHPKHTYSTSLSAVYKQTNAFQSLAGLLTLGNRKLL